MKTIAQRTLTLVALGATLLISCKKEKQQVDLPPPLLNSPELITSMVLQFTDSADASRQFSAAFRDTDGPGGNTPVKFDTIRLPANRTYLAELILLDETKTPTDTISSEIQEERNDHQFFFYHSAVALSTAYRDQDDKGLPVGLRTRWRSGSASEGSSRIRLKHQVGIKNGTDAPGETDIDVTFRSIIY